MKKFFVVTLIAIVVLVLVAGVSIFIFNRTSPQFGGTASEEKIAAYAKSGHYRSGIFMNEIPTNMDMSLGQGLSVMKDFIVGVPNQAPEKSLPVLQVHPSDLQAQADSIVRVTWFGHSAFWVEIDGLNLLIDPMFGPVPSPVSFLGKKRFSDGLPIEIADLPQIDAVVFSHDHYDHLDYESVVKLKDKVGKFYTPLGVGAHLQEWGVSEENIHELNWWDEINHGSLTLVCTPARHFSGRGLGDRFSTFWSSWIIKGENKSIYFSGDSGYGSHFKEIGEKYGPFDFAMMECGQYNERWSNIHMMPEETAQAAVDVQANLMMPIHWGSFVLALHTWDDPVRRVTAKANDLGQAVIVPQIGEQIVLHDPTPKKPNWWQSLK